jgi:hypothetical protein
MSSPDVTEQKTPALPALTLDDFQRYYLMEAKAAEDRAVEHEKRAATEHGRAAAFRAALEWLQGRLVPPQEAPA